MARRENCRCDEGFINGVRLENDMHDCDYVASRNNLKPAATARANSACGSSANSVKWVAEFLKAMNELAYETGLTKFPPRPEGAEYVVPVKLGPLPYKIRPVRHNKPRAN